MEYPKPMQIFSIVGDTAITEENTELNYADYFSGNCAPAGFYYYTGIYIGTNDCEEENEESTFLYVENMDLGKTIKISLSFYNFLKKFGILTEYEIATFVPA